MRNKIQDTRSKNTDTWINKPGYRFDTGFFLATEGRGEKRREP